MLDLVEPGAFLADKACEANALIDTLEQRGITPVIPPKANRTVQRHTDFALNRERNLVERFCGKLKAFRAIATRYDKLARTFLARYTAHLRYILAQLTTRSRCLIPGFDGALFSREWKDASVAPAA